MVASAFGFALMAFCVRLCDDYGGQVSCFQKSLFRNIVALILSLVVFFRARHGLLAAAGFFHGIPSFGVIHSNCYYIPL